MRIDSTKIVDGKIHLCTGRQEAPLPDGVYHRAEGGFITVKDNKVSGALLQPDLEGARPNEFQTHLDELEKEFTAITDDAQLATLQLQDAMNKQAQAMQMMSNIMKMMHDTTATIVKNMK
jgi:hypothetical protein